MRFERSANIRNDVRLLRRAQRGGRNDVAVVRGPVADADLAEFANDILECDGFASRSIEQRLPLICGGPLGTTDEIFASDFRTVTAATHFREAFDERSLLIWRYRFHGVKIVQIRTTFTLKLQPHRRNVKTRVYSSGADVGRS